MKFFRIFLMITGAVSLIVAGVAGLYMLKEKDPSRPGFKPDHFRFYDYQYPGDLRLAFQKLFPPGTSKEFVDQVLIKAGGARDFNDGRFGSYRRVTYIYGPNMFQWLQTIHIVIYDQNWQVINIHPHGGSKVFKEQPGKDEIRIIKKGEQDVYQGFC